MRENPIQPLQRSVEVQFDPAWGRGHCLSPVFGAPTFDKTHPDRAHPGELIDGLKALVHRLGEQRGELLVVEDLQIATRRDFTHLKASTNIATNLGKYMKLGIP